MSAIDDLTTEVSASIASVDAAIVVLGTGGSDTAQLVALTAQLATARAALNTAVAARSS